MKDDTLEKLLNGVQTMFDYLFLYIFALFKIAIHCIAIIVTVFIMLGMLAVSVIALRHLTGI